MRKNVAGQVIGAQMVSATDGSAFTGSVTVYVTGDAGTQAVGSVGSGACTHEGEGFHTYAPAQAETNYNHIAFTFKGTGAIPVTVQVYTVSYNPHDTVRLGITALPNAAADAAGGLPISDAGGLDLDTRLGYLTAGVATATALATAQADLDIITGTNGVTLATSQPNYAPYTGTPPTAAAIRAEIDSNSTQLAAILADTAEIGAAGAGLTAIPWNIAWDVEVQSECADALAAYDPPTHTELTTAFTEIKGATWSSVTDTLEALRDRGDAAWTTATGFSTLDAAGVRSAVGLASANLDTQLGAIETDTQDIQSRLPAALVAGRIDASVGAMAANTLTASALATDAVTEIQSGLATAASISALNNLSSADVNAACDTALADYDAPTKAELDAAFTEIKGATWSSVTDTLEALRDRGDAAWTTATGFSTLDAAGVRTAVGLASANLDTQLAGILADTAEIGAAGAGLTAIPWNASWDAEVQSEVQDAIEANHLDHLLATTYDPATKPGAADALLNELIESDAGVSRFTANALEQGPSGGGGVADWTADERTAIRSILGIPAVGTTPDDPTTGILDTIRDAVGVVDGVVDAIKLKTDNLPAAPAATGDIPSASTVASQVRTELTTELARIDVATSTRLASASYSAPLDAAGTRTALGLASANLDTQLGAIVADTNELQTDWANGGRLDLILDARASQTSVDDIPTNAELTAALGTLNDLSAAEVRSAVGLASANLDTQLATIVADTGELQTDWANGGRLDLILDNASAQAQTAAGVVSHVTHGNAAIKTAVDTVDAVVDSILVDTSEIGVAGAGLTAVPWNAAWDTEVQSEVTDALNAYDPPTNAELTAALAAADDAILAAIAALNNLSAAQVNAEVVDALATDTYAEINAVPGATASLAAKINWLYAWSKNKIIATGTTQSLRNDNDSADIGTLTQSGDDSAFIRSKWS